jgi:serine protease Do
MNFKPLSAALLAAGVLTVGTAGAIGLPDWLKSKPAATSTDTTAKAHPRRRCVGSSARSDARAQAVPNYRGIVKQSRPSRRRRDGRRHAQGSAEEQGLPPAGRTIRSSSFFRGMPASRRRGQRGGRRCRSVGRARASSSRPMA